MGRAYRPSSGTAGSRDRPSRRGRSRLRQPEAFVVDDRSRRPAADVRDRACRATRRAPLPARGFLWRENRRPSKTRGLPSFRQFLRTGPVAFTARPEQVPHQFVVRHQLVSAESAETVSVRLGVEARGGLADHRPAVGPVLHIPADETALGQRTIRTGSGRAGRRGGSSSNRHGCRGRSCIRPRRGGASRQRPAPIRLPLRLPNRPPGMLGTSTVVAGTGPGALKQREAMNSRSGRP